MRVPDGQYFTALSTRFERTCSSARGSPSIAASPGPSSDVRRTPFFSARSRKRASTIGTTRWSSTRSRFNLNTFDSSFESSSYVFDEALQALGISLDDVEEPDRRGGIGESAGLERLGRRADGGDGSAELV